MRLYFEVIGKGRESGRTRRRVYRATDEVDARAQAEADGMIPQTVKRTEGKGPPPSERQIKFAQDLRMEIPAGATAEDVSDLIDEGLTRRAIAYARERGFRIPQTLTDKEERDLRAAELDSDVPSNESDRRLAERYGVAYTSVTGKSALYHQILLNLKEGARDGELAEWFVFRVYRHRVKDADNSPIGSPNDPIIQEIARAIAADPQLMKSIRRYDRDLLHFGDWMDSEGFTRSGESDNSMAYKRVSEILRSRELVSPRGSTRSSAAVTQLQGASNKPDGHETKKSSLAAIIIVLIVAVALLIAVLG